MGVEVVARTSLGIIERIRVAGAPDGELGCRVVGAGLPQSAAAGFPGVGLVPPSIRALSPGLGQGVTAATLVAGLDVERRDPAARGPIARAIRHDDPSFGDE